VNRSRRASSSDDHLTTILAERPGKTRKPAETGINRKSPSLLLSPRFTRLFCRDQFRARITSHVSGRGFESPHLHHSNHGEVLMARRFGLEARMEDEAVKPRLSTSFPHQNGESRGERENSSMTDDQVARFLGTPALVTVAGRQAPLTGPLRHNDDGSYSIDSGLGTLENPSFVQRFSAAEIMEIRPL
jgi:hypothetical protein